MPPYPNPSNATSGKSITFTVGIREPGRIAITLYDLLGRARAVIAEDAMSREGISTFDFDASRFAPGTYIYRFQACGEVRSGKLVIEK